MTTATAAANNYRCPKCKEELTEDPSCKGFVRHKTKPDCDHEKGMRDAILQQTEPNALARDRG